MYRNCIFCSADLGSNDSIEQFPVGRNLAFDAARGRLWAVCPRCVRWNLAPLEERWEAIEAGERLFRDTRLRAQSENVGLAKLRDGTRLVRVGQALAGELAAWRYGRQITRRLPAFPRLRSALRTTDETVGRGVPLVMWGGLMLGTGLPAVIGAGWLLAGVPAGFSHWRKERRVVHVLPGATGARVRRADLDGARISMPDDGHGLKLLLPYSGMAEATRTWGWYTSVLRGRDAHSALARLMVHVNEGGAAPAMVETSVGLITDAGSPDELVNRVARQGHVLATSERPGVSGSVMPVSTALALEMALHEETERRAMEGELAMLEAMWRDAEEIAAIADRLPDELAGSHSARI